MNLKKFIAYFLLGAFSFYTLYFFIILPKYEIKQSQFFIRSIILIILVLIIDKFIIKKIK